METINTIQLGDESIFPNESILTGVLGRSYRAYCVLLELFDQNEMTPEWRYYRDGKAWLCKVQKMKRTIVWMSAWKGFSEDTKAHFRATKNVGQSKPCIFEVRNQKVLKDLNTVMQFKIRTR
jgi:hypothetical protein